MEGENAKLIVLVLVATALVVNFFAGVGLIKRAQNKSEEININEVSLIPETLAWDGEFFWTAHEPSWDMGSPDYQKPGGNQFQAYIFKHNNDQNLSIAKTYKVPNQYNVIGMTFINGELWTSSWLSEQQGRIYQYEIRDDQLFEKDSWKTEVNCAGLAWDGQTLWCNAGGTAGIIQFEIGNNLQEIKRFSPPPDLKPLKNEIIATGLAWDGQTLWSAYKHTYPVIIKHRMDESLSLEAGFFYGDNRLNFYPGGLTFANGTLYSSSSDPGTGNERGGRIAKHKLETNLPIEEIYYYNR